MHIVAEQQFVVGHETLVLGPAPEGDLAVVFSDDGEAGYFYALDTSREDEQIQDALHVYDVADIARGNSHSVARIGWSDDSTKAVLLIDGYARAVFDFQAKQGYCRAGFPAAPSDEEW